jgi:hypothetical protein
MLIFVKVVLHVDQWDSFPDVTIVKYADVQCHEKLISR